MSRWAQVQNDVVQNVIEADQAFVDMVKANWQFVIESDLAQMDDTYDHATGIFTRPPEPEPPPWPVIRTITVPKWFDRWTDEELGIFHTLAQTNESVAGWNIWLSRQSAVSLDDTRIIAKLQQGVASGRISQARMDALLVDVAKGEV
jgi:hypothetical protein